MESHKPYEPVISYRIVADSELPTIEHLQNLPSLSMDSTAADVYKYWNPATTNNKYMDISHEPLCASAQLIGESKQ